MVELTEGLVEEFGHGRAYSEPFELPQPAAGQPAVYPISGEAWERLQSVGFSLVTAGGGGNRLVELQVSSGGSVPLVVIPAAAVQAGGTTRTYTFLGGYSSSLAVGAVLFGPLPEGIFLESGWTVTVAVGGIAGGDQLSAVQLYRERYPTGARGVGMGREPASRPRRPRS